MGLLVDIEVDSRGYSIAIIVYVCSGQKYSGQWDIQYKMVDNHLFDCPHRWSTETYTHDAFWHLLHIFVDRWRANPPQSTDCPLTRGLWALGLSWPYSERSCRGDSSIECESWAPSFSRLVGQPSSLWSALDFCGYLLFFIVKLAPVHSSYCF